MCGGKEEVVAVLYYTKAKEERPLRKQSDINTNSRAPTSWVCGWGRIIVVKKARSLVMRLLVISIYFLIAIFLIKEEHGRQDQFTGIRFNKKRLV
jgi:hypothetical protein